MLITLTPSVPRVAKMTEMTPRILMPIARQRLPYVDKTNAFVEEALVEISEIHPVLVEIGSALWLVPNDLHKLFCSYKIT